MVCASRVFATYVHHLDPVVFSIGKFSLRWYGLAYLGGFAAGFLLLRYLAQRKLWVLKPEEAGDFIAAAALLGVFVGGRLGYVLFYEILDSPAARARLMHDPLSVLRVWEGGMASHGGILGLFIFTWFYSRRKGVAWTALGDGLCVVAPVGLFFGRLANFINGELYGRIDRTVSWAMKFPMALNDGKAPENLNLADAMYAVGQKVPEVAGASQKLKDLYDSGANEQTYSLAHQEAFGTLLDANRRFPEVREILANYLEPRHPSQLYEAALEGVALFSILWFVRLKFPKAPNGLLTGLFFFFYASFRILGEQFREPDAVTFNVLGAFITKGQFLSFFMFAFAAAFFFHAWRGWKKAQPQAG